MTYIADLDRYDGKMTDRRSGRSGLQLPRSRSACGTTSVTTPLETQRAILRRAFDLGVTHFDLANNYGPPYGSAEVNFGRLIARTSGRTGTSWSSPPRPGTTCGPARTASGGRASTCSPASTSR